MSGPTDVKLARLGDTVDAVVVLEWLVAVGDESPFSGTVVELLVAEDDEVATGTSICRIDVP